MDGIQRFSGGDPLKKVGSVNSQRKQETKKQSKTEENFGSKEDIAAVSAESREAQKIATWAQKVPTTDETRVERKTIEEVNDGWQKGFYAHPQIRKASNQVIADEIAAILQPTITVS